MSDVAARAAQLVESGQSVSLALTASGYGRLPEGEKSRLKGIRTAEGLRAIAFK